MAALSHLHARPVLFGPPGVLSRASALVVLADFEFEERDVDVVRLDLDGSGDVDGGDELNIDNDQPRNRRRPGVYRISAERTCALSPCDR
jgi:hypothetical protein